MATPSNKSIVKAVDLVEIVCSAPEGVSLREAAKAANLSLATTHRILSTLRSVGALSLSHDGTYMLGPRLLALHEQTANADRAVQEVVEAHITGMLCFPAMSVRLSVFDTTEVYIFAGVDNGVSAKMRSRIGARYEAYCTAPGKVLLAGLSGHKLDNYLFGAGFIAMTSNTIVIPSRLSDEIKRVHLNGYAIDDGEFIEGVRCISVPVRMLDGQVVAALSIAAETMLPDEIDQWIACLNAGAEALAGKLSRIPEACGCCASGLEARPSTRRSAEILPRTSVPHREKVWCGTCSDGLVHGVIRSANPD